jgi:plastocyanin
MGMRLRFGFLSLIGIVALTALLAHVAENTASATDATASPTASADPGASAAPVAKTASVNTLHFAYDPSPLTVAVGTKVSFKNSDEVAHTVTSLDGGDKPAFDSGDMAQNATWSHVFTKAGTYAYYCQYHPYMKGTIVVK